MAVATIQAQMTVKAREAALATLASVIRDPITRARMRADLKPLTQFGSKADAEDTLGLTPSAAAANDNSKCYRGGRHGSEPCRAPPAHKVQPPGGPDRATRF